MKIMRLMAMPLAVIQLGARLLGLKTAVGDIG